MTSLSPSQKSDQNRRTDTSAGRHYLNNPVLLKEELRQSIIAKRHARGEKQLNIEHREPQEMALTPAEVEKKERRREQNRRAAQRCRHKKRLNQKHVIQNYEQVVAKNDELQKELDAVKRELNKIRNTHNHHLMCCPSYGNVNPESSQAIKREPMSVDEVQNVNTDMSVCGNQYSGKKANVADIPRFVPNTLNTYVHSSGSDQRATNAGLLDCGTSSSTKQQQQIDLVPQETDFLQSPHSNSADTNQAIQWGYLCAPGENNSPTSDMLSELNPEFAAFLVSAQLKVNSHKYLRHQKQDYELQPQQQSHIESAENISSDQRGEAVHTSTIPSNHHLSTQRYTFVDDSGQVMSQNSPCHVVPSLRSPRPDSVTSTISCTYDNIRHRSLSGGSGCTSDEPRRCRTEREFSSVSSEGSWSTLSMYQDLRTLEVSDTDTDDVFMNPPTGPGIPLEGHDDNNNLEALPDNNIALETGLFQLLQARSSEIDWLSSTPLSTNSFRDAAPRASDPIIDSDDINPLIQLSSDDLQIFNEFDDNDILYSAFQ